MHEQSNEGKNVINNKSFFTVHGWMINELKLKGNELLVYAIIYSFSQDGISKFTGSRKYLAEFTNSSIRTVQSSINALIEKGLLLKTEKVINNIKYCYYVTSNKGSEKISPPPVKKLHTPGEKISPPPVKKLHTPGEKIAHYNIDYNINNIIKESVCREKTSYTQEDISHTLTQSEYDYLISKYDNDIVNQKMCRAKKYKNCNNLITIENWIQEELEKKKSIAKDIVVNTTKPKEINNKFNNFNQRHYSEQDLNELEKKLLNR